MLGASMTASSIPGCIHAVARLEPVFPLTRWGTGSEEVGTKEPTGFASTTFHTRTPLFSQPGWRFSDLGRSSRYSTQV